LQGNASTATTASFAQTASYVENAQTASYVTTAQTASYVENAQTASYVENAQTASFVTTAQTASYVENAQTASYVENAQTASFVNTLNQSVTITGAITASGNISASGNLQGANFHAFNAITRVGASAGFGNTGTFQTVVGVSAGSGNSGNSQTAVGSFAGYNNSGATTIAIGSSGQSNSGDNLVAIGYAAGNSNTLDNQFIVKHSVASATPLIQGNFQSGSIGIGIALPQANLHVAGNIWASGSNGHITASGNISASGDIITTKLRDSVGNNHIVFGNNNNTIAISSDDGEIMTLDGDSQRVGINKTTPGEALEVVGNISASGTITANSFVGALTGDATGLTGTPDIVVGSLTATSITSSIVTSSIIYTEGSNIFGDAISDTHLFNGHITSSGNISASGTILGNEYKIAGGAFGTYLPLVDTIRLADQSKKTIIDGSTITFFDAPTKIVGHLTASGNISASGYLVAQNITASANISASGTGSFGMVGIGTTTPAQKLDVKDGFIQVSGSSASGYGYLLNRAGQDTYSIRHLDGGLTINNETDNRKEMTFDGNGNVGIGATSPTAKLHVSGNIWASGSSGHITASANISASGTITATSFTGSLKGTASTASIATTVTLTATNTTNATHYLTFTDAATGNENVRTDTSLTYNPSSNTLATTAVTATTVSASIVGAVAYQYNDPESLVAAGISQGTATAITKAGPIFVTGVATGGILLPSWSETVYILTIHNISPTDKFFLYPSSGESIGTLGSNAPATVPEGGSIILTSGGPNGGQWFGYLGNAIS
jgi:hypothetical protein